MIRKRCILYNGEIHQNEKGECNVKRKPKPCNLEKETKKAERKAKIRETKTRIVYWLDDNKEWLIPLIPVTIGGVVTTAKVVGKHSRLNKEKNLKELYCYDRSLGHYWELRRKLTNAEWLSIETRRKNGERLADILAELKVLK